MKQKVCRFFLSVSLYCLASLTAKYLIISPAEIVSTTTFLPPLLGFMWGPPAAFGVYIGAVVYEIVEKGIGVHNYALCFSKNFWVFLAGYLPVFFWKKWENYFDKGTRSAALSLHTLRKFLAVMFATFVVTSAFRAVTASEVELSVLAGWNGSGRVATLPIFMLACFLNDFFIAIFFDIALFFLLLSENYPLYCSSKNQVEGSSILNTTKNLGYTHKTRVISFSAYVVFPIAIIYLNNFQIYGMDNIKTWLRCVSECLVAVDVYLVLMLFLLLRYRRSIMMEIVFLVSQTVFFTATVLGWGSSIAMADLVESHTKVSLHAMSVICRERLYRTFFCVRQAINGMTIQALNAIESYDSLANDAEYRKNYLEKMKKDFSAISVGIDGSISYYLRLIPEIEGTKGGFSMQREDARWEGALSPFVEREPVDLAPYDPRDSQNVGWFYIPYRSGCPTWIEPYFDPVTNFYVISYVAPLYVEGKFVGVLGMDIDFNFIVTELRRMSIYDYGYVYIKNRNNTVLYHRQLPQGAEFKPNPQYEEMEIYLANGMWLGIATPLSHVYDERNNLLMHLVAAVTVVAMLISLASITLASRAIRPLAGMTEAAKRIASGDLNVKISYESGNELGILVKSIMEMASKLEVYVYRDKLTGLRNAAAYISKAAELDAQNSVADKLKYGVVIFDANFLKKINDNYGHDAGNELIRRAAKVICKVFSHSPVYRIGGDEFAAVLQGEDYDKREQLLRLFDEIAAEERFETAGDTLTISVARGLGIYETGMDFATVAHQADAAMYDHKLAIKSKFGEEVR
ncbi:MAG: diguanylate cyclase [Selenomonadaceae bacterium]|nr:diguanylate cyclase [Selenomonadaceae bacterium]